MTLGECLCGLMSRYGGACFRIPWNSGGGGGWRAGGFELLRAGRECWKSLDKTVSEEARAQIPGQAPFPPEVRTLLLQALV